nr:unnamed protein product [Callosobruchus analis]
MTVTREIFEEIKSSVKNILANSLEDPAFIKTVADKAAEAIVKTVSKQMEEFEHRLAILEKNVVDLNINCGNNRRDTKNEL